MRDVIAYVERLSSGRGLIATLPPKRKTDDSNAPHSRSTSSSLIFHRRYADIALFAAATVRRSLNHDQSATHRKNPHSHTAPHRLLRRTCTSRVEGLARKLLPGHVEGERLSTVLVERLISRKNTEGNGKESTFYSLVRADAPLHTVTARGSAQYGLLRLDDPGVPSATRRGPSF